MPLPNDMFLASEKYKFIYIVIPKAATTSIKTWMMKIEDKEITYVHDDCRKLFQLNRSKTKSKNYFKFTFVRDPYKRLVSSFLNKFVNYTKPRLSNAIYLEKKIRGNKQRHKGITFREFVDHIEKSNKEKVDVHWRPQHLFIQEIKPDFIGKVENIHKDFKTIQDKINVELPLSIENKTKKPKNQNQINLSDALSSDIRLSNTIPHWSELYDGRLLSKVGRIYKDDFKTFGYEQ